MAGKGINKFGGYVPRTAPAGGRVIHVVRKDGYTPTSSGRPPVPPRGGSAVRPSPVAQTKPKPK